MARNYTNKKGSRHLHAGISENSRCENLESPVVRLIACSLATHSDSAISKMYESGGFYISSRAKDMQFLREQGLLEILRVETGYYSYTNVFKITPQGLVDTLARMNEKELDKTLAILEELENSGAGAETPIKPAPFGTRKNLARAIFYAIHNDGRFLDLFKEEFPALLRETMERQAPLLDLLLGMVEIPETQALVDSVTGHLRAELMQRYLDAAMDMKRVYDWEKAHYLFFNEENLSYIDVNALQFVTVTRILVDGDLDALLNQYDVPADGPMNNGLLVEWLKAVQALHLKDPKPMIEAMKTLVDVMGCDFLAVPPMALFPLAARIMDGTPETARLFNRWQKKLGRGCGAVTKGVLGWLSNSKIGAVSINNVKDSLYNPSSVMVFGFYVLLMKMQSNNSSDLVKLANDARAKVAARKFNYIKMLYCSLSEETLKETRALSEQMKLSPLFLENIDKPDWERKLDRLEAQLKVNTRRAQAAMGPGKQQRVAYLISDSRYVQPISQTSNDGVKWSGGRSVALKSFYQGITPRMTDQDRRVAACVTSYSYYYGGPNYTLPFEEALYQLIGHPYVFRQEDRLKIDVSELVPQLSVTRTRDRGFQLKSNLPADHYGNSPYIVDRTNPLHLQVGKITREQEELFKALGELKALPKEAEGRLQELLGSLSQHVTVMSDLLAESDTSRRVDGSPLAVVQMIPVDDMIEVKVYAKPLGSEPPYLLPGKGTEFVNGVVQGETVQAQRDLQLEIRNFGAVEKMLAGSEHGRLNQYAWELDIEETLDLLEKVASSPEQACVEWPEGARMQVKRGTLQPDAFKFMVKSRNNWFEMEGKVQVDTKTIITVAELLEKLRNTPGRFIRLQGNEYVALSQHLADTLRSISRLAEISDGKAGMSAFHADFMQDLADQGLGLKLDRGSKSMIDRIEKADKAEIKTPKGIQADLRDYQKEGYRWMARLALWGAGACLADDMGLGKTLQTICLMHARRKQGASLVVAPTSLLLNWRDEIARFAPSLSVEVVNDYQDTGKRSEIIGKAAECDVVIVSYGLMVNEIKELAKRSWNVITLDEAHTIKNRDTKMSKAAMTLKGDMRVALTGTPLQNRLSEIWNIFQFTNPGLLGSFESFTERFITPIESDSDKKCQKLLKRMISPFLLRRTKNDVLDELPSKTEIEVRVELGPEEQALYENLRQQAEIAVQDGGPEAAFKALAEITKLRQAACNPRLIDEKLDIGSSKTAAFMEIVANLRSNHHRALVFSQFTSHLALIRKALDEAGVEYLSLDGSTTAAQRTRLVQEFQTGDMPLFLISLKAGGLGLNLTAADYVVHLDPWWNPAVEDQASDRSHRIGQTKPVTVYRIIAAGTIEEKILRLHAHKKNLADALLEGSDMSARLTREEILALLREN